MRRILAAAYPETNARRGVRVMALADEVRRHHDLGFIVPVVFAMVGCVLLIACVNVTNVMLARTSARRQEMAIRLALGASRSRIVRQWLVEHVLLFVAASAIGAILAVYGTAWITNSIPVDNRQYLRNYAVLTVDRGVLLFALITGAICGAVFGWVPAWSGAQADINLDLRDGSGRTTGSRAASGLRSTLVIVEVALALALLISAGLLVQTRAQPHSADVGFDPRDRLTFQLALDPQKYSADASVRGFYDRLIADLRGRPGVADAAAGSLVPFAGDGAGAEFFFEGQADLPPADTPVAAFNAVTDGYDAALQLRLERGRFLNAADSAESLKVAVINRTMAARYFGDREPVGSRLRIGRGSRDLWTVVGIVGDVKNYETTDAAAPQLYVPFAQRPNRRMTVVVRSRGRPGCAGRHRPRRRGGDRFRRAGVTRVHDGRAHPHGHRSIRDAGHVRGLARRRHAPARRRRRVRRGLLHVRAADEGDWHPHGARRTTHRRRGPGAETDPDVLARGPDSWTGSRLADRSRVPGDAGRRDARPTGASTPRCPPCWPSSPSSPRRCRCAARPRSTPSPRSATSSLPRMQHRRRVGVSLHRQHERLAAAGLQPHRQER